MTDILVYAELLDDELTDVSLQCLIKGRELAEHAGANLHVVMIGSGLGLAQKSADLYGANFISIADDERLKSYLVTPYASIVVDLARSLRPALILMPSSTQGNDLASAVARRLDAAPVLECRALSFSDGTYTAQRLEYDGKVLTHFTPTPGRALLATVKDGMVEVTPREASQTPCEVVKLAVPPPDIMEAAKVIGRELAKKTVNLKAAKIIITAGAGIGNAENYKLVENLAAALGGEVGATRPVVDAGWATADRQIGQTGVTVKPDVYIACGVSGAVQHRVGMGEAKKIIAINTDPAAPIFKFADYCIQGDLKEVLPKLIELIG